LPGQKKEGEVTGEVT